MIVQVGGQSVSVQVQSSGIARATELIRNAEAAILAQQVTSVAAVSAQGTASIGAVSSQETSSVAAVDAAEASALVAVQAQQTTSVAAVVAAGDAYTGVSVLFVPDTSNNLADPDIADALLPTTADQTSRVYSTANGSLFAQSPGTLGTYGVFKKYPVPPGGAFAASLRAAATGDYIYLTGVPRLVFFKADKTFDSVVSSGFTVDGGVTPSAATSAVKTVEATAPATAHFIGLSVLSTAHNNSNPMSEATLSAMEAVFMLNAGATALPYEPPVDPAFPLVPGPIFDPKTYQDADDVRCYYDGEEFVYARTRLNSSYDKVNRFRFGFAAESGLNNGLWDHWGERWVATDTPMEQLVTAFDASTVIRRTGVDENPPIQINSITWLGGSHRPVVQQATITGHGFVSGDIGSLWSDGVRDRMLWAIVDANTTQWLALNTGTITAWNFSSALISGTTLTHVSGGIATSNKTVSGTPTFVQSSATFVRDRVGRISIDGREVAQGTAAYFSGAVLSFDERYNIPNLARSAAYMIANNGASPTNAAIGSQIEVSMTVSIDWTGATHIVWTPLDVEAYTPVQYGGAQAQPLYRPTGTNTFAIVPGSKGFTASAVSYDFDDADGHDITSLAASLSFTKTLTWDDPAKPPYAIAYVNRASSVPQYGMLYVMDETVGQGLTATRAGMNNALLLTTGFLKSYIVGGDPASSAGAGQLHEFANSIVTFDATADTALSWAAPYPKGGKTAYSIRAPGALTAHWVSVDPRLNGQPVVKSRDQLGVATLLSSVVSGGRVCVTWSALGEIELTIG